MTEEATRYFLIAQSGAGNGPPGGGGGPPAADLPVATRLFGSDGALYADWAPRDGRASSPNLEDFVRLSFLQRALPVSIYRGAFVVHWPAYFRSDSVLGTVPLALSCAIEAARRAPVKLTLMDHPINLSRVLS